MGGQDSVPIPDTDPHTGQDSGKEEDTGIKPPPPPAPALVFDGDRPQNVLIISVDTTRRDQLGVYSGLDTTPNLDAILGAGVVLDDHRSCANWTAPSMLCAVTGRFPLSDDYWPTGVYESQADPRVAGIPSGLPTLASLLSERGYATGLITANTVFSSNNTSYIVEGFQQQDIPGWYGAPQIVPRATNMANQLAASGKPWMLHVHFIDPHGPYVAPPSYSYELETIKPGYTFPFDVTLPEQVYSLMSSWPALSDKEEALALQYLLAVYHGEIRYWDSSVGSLWDNLEQDGLLDDTLVVFFSDHGEQFGEHKQFQHGKDLFSEENRVLGGFWAKNMVPGRWMGPTLHQDLAPTVLDALAVEPSPEHEGQVVGLAPDDRARYAFCYLPGYCDAMMSIVQSDRQLIYRWDGKRFFYDLSTDPETAENLYDADDPEVQALWAQLQPEVMKVYARWSFLTPTDADP